MNSGRLGVRGLGAAHDERRRSIVAAVLDLIDTAGIDQVSIRNVAHRAGVSPGRVQHYFPTKDALLSEAFNAISDRGAARVRARHADGPAVVLRELLGGLIPHNEEEVRLFRIARAFEAYAIPRPHLREQLTRGYEDLADLIALLLRDILRPEQDAPSPFLAEAHELLALTIGLAELVVSGNITPEQADRIAARRLADTLSPHLPSGEADRRTPVTALLSALRHSATTVIPAVDHLEGCPP